MLGPGVFFFAFSFKRVDLRNCDAFCCRTMSSVRSQASGQNLFILVVKFLETFVGSMSTGQLATSTSHPDIEALLFPFCL